MIMDSFQKKTGADQAYEAERGRSPAAAYRQPEGLRRVRKPQSSPDRCARGPGALRVARFQGGRSLWTTWVGFCQGFLRSLGLRLVPFLLFLTPPLFGQVVIFSEDFEGAFPAGGGWIVGDADPIATTAYWDTVDSTFGGEGVHSGSRKAYCAGFGFAGTTDSPMYQNDMIAFMNRSLNLGGYSGASMSFWFKIPSTEEGVDRAQLLVDGETVWSMNTAVTAWTRAAINLDRFVGGVRTLQFQFVSDATQTNEGWYVDDVLVTGTLGIGPSNDAFTNAFSISGTTGVTNGTSLGATKEAGEPNHAGNAGGKSVWYRWTPASSGTVTFDTLGSSFDTLLAVYTGSSVASLSPVASNDDISPGVTPQSRVVFSATAGTAYRIAVDGYAGASGSVVLNWTQSLGPPANDSFGNAFTLSGSSGTTNGSTLDATKQSGEPNHAFNAGGHSVWYRWTAPASGAVTFNTLGSAFDTLLGVYTGNSLGSLTVVATNDDLSVNFAQSQVSFAAVSGTTYRIAVDGYDGAAGSLVLNWAQGIPANDLFANAFTLTGMTGSTNANNFNAAKEVGEPDHASESGGPSVWYRWTAPVSGPVAFNTEGSLLDTLLAVYTGSQVGNLSVVASNHYSATSLKSRLDFSAVAGTSYYIAIDGFDGAEWTFNLSWHAQTPPRFTAITPQAGGAVQLTLTGAGGDRYAIQTSSDFLNWTQLSEATNLTGTVLVIDPAPADLQFYRALLEP